MLRGAAGDPRRRTTACRCARASTAARPSAATSARLTPAHLRGHGRHRQSRRAARPPRRAGRDPGDGRRARPVAHAVRDRARSRSSSRARSGRSRPTASARVSARRSEEPQAELPLVGRDAELAALAEAVNAARMRQQRLVELVGEPGIGKSRLVEELKTQRSASRSSSARCEQYAAATPYFVFRDAAAPARRDHARARRARGRGRPADAVDRRR